MTAATKWQIALSLGESGAWRDALLRLILRVGVTFGPVAYVPSLYMALRSSMPAIAFIDSVAMITVLILHFRPGWSYRVRAGMLSLLIYALGTWLLAEVGAVSQIYLFGFSLITTMLLGLRFGLATVALNGATLLLIGGSGSPADMIVPRWGPDAVAWFVITLNFLLVDLLLTLAIGAVIRNIEGALAREHDARTALEIDRRRLLDANHALEAEIQVRQRAEAERENLENQLRQAQKMEAVGRLAGGVAHDFNNMLSVIIGHAELLRDVRGQDVRREHADEIMNAAQRSADLTRQLLAFARKQTITPAVLNLNETIEGMIKMLRRLVGEDIALEWRPARPLRAVRIDAAQIDQILANLVVNARDAVRTGGTVQIRTSNADIDASDGVELGIEPGRYVALAVSDNGCGMDSPTLANLFEPFFTTKEVGKGTGLGLATVYGIVKQNGGAIQVQSDVGHGTTFQLYFPEYAGALTTGPSNHAETAAAGSETILVLEDEKAVLGLVSRFLVRLGYRVLAADSASAALALAATHDGPIELLISDVIMPEMTGPESWRRVQAIRPGIKCLFMSGYTADVIARSGMLEKGVHFLPKPFNVQTLAAKVREALDA